LQSAFLVNHGVTISRKINMKPWQNAANLFRLSVCVVLLLGLTRFEVLASGEKSKSRGTKPVQSSKERQAPLWEQGDAAILPARGQRLLTPQKYLVFRLNQTALSELLAQLPLEFTAAARAKTVIMEVPMPDGKLAPFRVEESRVLAPSVAAELPGVKTFSGQGIDDPSATARFDWTPLKGFHGYVLSQAGTVYVDPYQENDRENYFVYYKHEYGTTGRSFHCDLDRNPSLIRADYKPSGTSLDFTNGTDLRTYRIAISGTGEYTAFQGGQTNALAAVVTAVNRLIGIYRREAAISFTLVSGTNILFPDAATDPYDNSGDPGQLTINQTQLDTIIGAANYDVGHLFVTSGGGLASTPSVCSNQKAEGLSGLPAPTGDPFVVDFVAHEIGHQFSGQHTFNDSGDGGCTTRSANDAFEPGSGTTIMSYCGVCDPRNLQGNSLDLFSVQSLTQIINYRNDNTGGGSCGTVTTPGNTPPVLGALANFTIPRNTPFSLTALATDANDPANQLTYSWEENDLGPASGTATTPDTDADGMARPIFRVMPPSNAGATRNFPSLVYILNNANVPPATYTGTSATGAVCNNGPCVTGESLPSIGRVMNFRVTVRDNNGGSGGAADAGMTVTVDGATGPFRVTAPNTNVSWQANSTQTVNWDVNGSSANAANVKISLSTNGGQTFPTTLLASTANNGAAQITVPNVATTQARIKVEGVNNIFFDISDANFTITGGTPQPTILGNISTRLRVETGDNALIGGFIITGTQPKKVLVRAIGPSLPLAGFLADPTLELRDGAGALLRANDNWRTDQEVEINATGIPPTNNLESAIVQTLPANNAGYTAIVRGANNTTGIGLVEAYDLDRTVDSKLGNISTRGLVQTGDNVLIAGTIVLGTTAQKVLVRGIGPSLPLVGKLADPTLELRDANGVLLRSNDNWRTDQETEIMATGIPPTDNLESALIHTLPANGASYTAILRGVNNTTGVAVVEIYAIN
jgi:hypothetical protein